MPEPIHKLAVVGASVRAAVFSALRAGYEVAAADLFADADLQAVCTATRIKSYPESFAEWLDATPCDGWLYTGALENYPELIARMSKLKPLLGNSGAALRAARSPMILQPVLTDAGIAFPETVDADARLTLDGSWLCKTYRGASGSGVWLLDGVAALERARRENAVFQRFVSGVSAAAILLCSAAGGRVMGVTRQLVGDARAGAKPWHYAGSIGPLTIAKEIEAQLNLLADLLSQRFQLRGVIGVDLVIAKNRAWVLEINPRYSSSAEIVERVSGVSLVETHVAACRDELPAPPAAPDAVLPTHGKIVVYAKRSCTVSDRFVEWAMTQSSITTEHCRLADIPTAGQELRPGQPVLTAFAAGAAKDIDAELGRRVVEVEARLQDARGDDS